MYIQQQWASPVDISHGVQVMNSQYDLCQVEAGHFLCEGAIIAIQQ